MTGSSVSGDQTLPRVLIVDDRPDNLLALEATLSELPCELVRAGSGEEALRHLLVEDVALLLLDVQMPGLDGYATARHIRQREKTSHIPVIFLSGIDRDLEHQLRGYETGAVDFLPKPFEPAALVMKVRVFLDLHVQARQVEASRRELAERVEELRAARAELDAKTVALSRSNVELEGFAKAASRALLEPAHLVVGFLDLLAAETDGWSEREMLLLERAGAAAARLTGTAEELALYATATTDLGPPVVVGLAETLEQALADLSGAIDATGARVTSDPMPVVLGDPWHLRRVLVEIIGNSLHHATGRPDVHLGVSRRGPSWVVTVHDDGPGIEPPRLAELFSPFAGAPGSDGLHGVGLAFCSRAITRLGGEIWAASTPGQGTDISFSLPDGGGS